MTRKMLLCAAAVLPMLAVAQPAQAQRAGDRIPGRYICVFNKNVSSSNVEAESRRVVQPHGGLVTDIYRATLRGFAANIPDAAAQRLKTDNPNIAYCEQEQIFTIPPIRAQGMLSGDFTAMAQETPWGIARVNGGVSGANGTAWVIDTGIQPDHPDLNVDTARSRTFIGRASTPWDQHGHGTHVAGTIAARDNGSGVIGVAAGARVASVRVLNRRGSGTTSGVIAGVDYVAQAGQAGDVANMSLGGGVSKALDDAVVAASTKVKFALAAGNESDNANNHSPARANGPNIYTVSAFAIGDKWASFSNFGSPPIDYAEPGVAIKSTWVNGRYNTISGTSMATPHLAGLLLIGTVKNGGAVIGDPDTFKEQIGVH